MKEISLFVLVITVTFLFQFTCFAQVTMSQYIDVKTGMTYSQVVRILGSPDQELSRSEMAGYTTVIYMWEGNSLGGNMNVMFQNGKVINKAQFGLKSNVLNRSIRTDDIKSIPQSYIPSPSDYYKVVHRSSLNNIKKSEIQKIEKLISKYGKPFIINWILDKRNDYITLRVGDELRDFGGRPGEEYVTSETILIDIENIGITVNELDKLVQEQAAN